MKIKLATGQDFKIQRIIKEGRMLMIVFNSDLGWDDLYPLLKENKSTTEIKHYTDENDLRNIYQGYTTLRVIQLNSENHIEVTLEDDSTDGKLNILEKKMDELENIITILKTTIESTI